MFRKVIAATAAFALAFSATAPVYAFDCTPAKKPTKAGAVGVVDINTGEFTPTKKNPGTEDKIHGGFVNLDNGETTESTFAHAPQGVLPPVREGGPHNNCDGKGLDSLDACGFFPEGDH